MSGISGSGPLGGVILENQSVRPCPPSPEDMLDMLKGELQKVSLFLPANVFKNFDPSNVTVSFDIQRLDATSLTDVHRLLAASFWSEREVQELFAQNIAPFTLVPKSLEEPITEAATKCIAMAQLVQRLAPKVMDRNLERIWERLVFNYPAIFPRLIDVNEMRAWLNNIDNRTAMSRVGVLDFTRSSIQILPPEVNLIPATSVYLHDSKIGAIPHTLEAHPTMDFQNVHCGDHLGFTDGTLLIEESQC